jgi:glycosyltransferase involved in cell wall biosynthesis
MIIGIDASNISKGGGITHLVEILNSFDNKHINISRIYIFSSKSTLKKISNNEKIIKICLPVLEKSIFHRILWQKFELPQLLKYCKCNVLFSPGGPTSTNFHTKITMSRNMHPFVNKELFRFSIFDFMAIKYYVIRLLHPFLFKQHSGLIFLNDFAKDEILKIIGKYKGKIAIIPHGINSNFYFTPRPQYSIENYSTKKRFSILYVSKIDVHKHQANVASAILKLYEEGFPIKINFIGPIDSKREYAKFNKVVNESLLIDNIINYSGDTNYSELPSIYHESDMFIFASTCENMPNILLEAMASGLPIACSSTGPMPSILGDGGIYFNAESVDDIAEKIKRMILSKRLREEVSKIAFLKAKNYSWNKCSKETFSFIIDIVNNKN